MMVDELPGFCLIHENIQYSNSDTTDERWQKIYQLSPAISLTQCELFDVNKEKGKDGWVAETVDRI
jgi:hypothetical protein